jgi:AcrR family transcriptional regulator
MSTPAEFEVPADLIAAAVRAAEGAGRDVADVPLTAIAAAAGISRSTLVRRLHGSRRALDEAVRSAGVDPGGRPAVRVRAVEAGARLISERGLAAVTLDAVAEAARCSVHSLYAAFRGRDELFAAIYERYSPLSELEDICAHPPHDLKDTVMNIYRAMAAGFIRQPGVMPAMLADLLARPDGPTSRIFAQYFPRAFAGVGGWLATQVRAGRIRNLPVSLLMQQLTGPLVVHLLFRTHINRNPHWNPTDLEATCHMFADAFVRAVGSPVAES